MKTNLFKSTSLSALISFIETVNIGETFTRKEAISHVRKHVPNNSDQNVDNYRNYMTRAGYLEITSFGVYKRLKEFPEDISVQKLLIQAYPNYTPQKY